MKIVKPKRILVVSPFFYPHIGGSQTYMENIYAYLIKKHPEVKVDVLCYNTDHASAKSTHKGLTIYRLPCVNILKGQFALPNYFSLIKFLWKNRKNYNLYHCSTRFFDSSVWMPIFTKLIGKKVFLTDHCATHPVHQNPFIKWLAKILDLTIFNFSLHLFDKVFTTSRASQKFLQKAFHIRSKVIYGGVNTSIFKPTPTKSRSIENQERLRIVFIGRMIESKGVRMLFNIARSYPEANFIFAGPGPEVKNFKLKNIKILGPLSSKRISKLLVTCDIFVHPSFHHEGFPNAIVEAGACKLAVIATDVGGSKEIVINQKTGILIAPHDQTALEKAILTLIGNKGVREKLSQNIYQYVREKFSWEKASEQLNSFLDPLV